MNLAGATRVLDLEDTVARAGRPGGRAPEAARRGRPRTCGPRWPASTAATAATSSGINPRNPRCGMDFTKLTVKAQEAFASAQGDAVTPRQPRAHPRPPAARAARPGGERGRAHPREGGPAPGRDPRRASRPGWPALPRIEGANVQPAASRATRQALEQAFTEAEALKDEYVAVEHLLLALAAGADLDRAAILKAVAEVRGGQRVTSPDAEGTYEALAKFGRDLTDAAERGKLDPVIGRDEEVRRVIQVLSRRTKNNPVLIGEPGVGKTAIVEGLAQRITSGDVPDGLHGQARLGARRRLAARRHEVPRRVRGAAEGGAGRDPRLRRPDHRLHRRAAHDRRRRAGRGRGRRRQPAEADARPRRAAGGRRDDARRVPQATSRRTPRSSGGSSR